jgi:hypothetical protein
MRSPKYDPRRQHRSGTLSKKIISGLLMIAAGIFLVAIIRGVILVKRAPVPDGSACGSASIKFTPT